MFLLASHIDNSLVFMLLGIIAILYPIWRSSDPIGKASFVIGFVVTFITMSVMFVTSLNPSPNPIPNPNPVPIPVPVPNPNPTPTPIPGPTPVTPFGANVIRTFNGSKAEAQVLSALFSTFGGDLQWDGTRSDPVIDNTNELGVGFADLQRYRGMSESPWASRFPEMKTVIANEMTSRGIIQSGVSNLDASKRSVAVNLFNEVGSALAQYAEAIP